MKPSGTIPDQFRARDGALLIGGLTAEQLAERAGDTPLFAYDFSIIEQKIGRLHAAFPGVGIHFALKANPFPPLARRIAALVDGIDIASVGEMMIALGAGMAPHCLSFAGPGKRDRELEAAIGKGVTINLESRGEAERALRIADRLGERPKLAVRVNPDFDLKGSGMRMGGGAKPFGIDAIEVPGVVRLLIEQGADWRGLHIYAGSQALDARAIIDAQAATVALAGSIAAQIGTAPPVVNLGGGFGIPYFHGEAPLDIEAIGQALAEALAARDAALSETHFAIELGRWLVGEAGVYLTRVVDRKVSHGQTFLVVDGGLHHQLAASGNFGTVVRRNYPIAVAHRFGVEPEEEVSVVGCLCTPLDRLGDQVMLPRADVGDVIAIFCAGAYGATASPAAFLGHPPAAELLVG